MNVFYTNTRIISNDSYYVKYKPKIQLKYQLLHIIIELFVHYVTYKTALNLPPSILNQAAMLILKLSVNY